MYRCSRLCKCITSGCVSSKYQMLLETLLLQDWWKVVEIWYTCVIAYNWPQFMTLTISSQPLILGQHHLPIFTKSLLLWHPVEKMEKICFIIQFLLAHVSRRRSIVTVDQSISVNISFIFIIPLFTCYSHYVIIIVYVIIFGQGSIALSLWGGRKNRYFFADICYFLQHYTALWSEIINKSPNCYHTALTDPFPH